MHCLEKEPHSLSLRYNPEMKKLICLLLILILAVPPGPALAWSEGGHHIISLMAFDLLGKEEQAKLVAILEKHPRFAEDFAPPAKLPNDVEKLRWRIGRAGYWPDIARSQPKYHRSTWHYELGPSLVIGDKANMKVPERPGALPIDATLATQSLYIAQALTLCGKTLADAKQSEADRAVAFCWIAHLVADAHQPCHAGSLYMEKVFVEEDGDRGANRIITKQRRNMHALWDQLLGPDLQLSDVRRRIVEISHDEELMAKGKQAIATSDGMNPLTWLSESRAAAIRDVYTDEVLDSLNLVARGVTSKPEAIDLSEAYLKNAGRVAQVRAIEASRRLAATWRAAIR